MFPVGGVGVMLAIIAVGGVLCAVLALPVARVAGTPWDAALALLAWSLVVIGAITLIPADGAPGIVPAASRHAGCSWDIGGPAPDGFWILPGGQRLLNALLFVPPGALLVLVSARWARWALLAVPGGLGLLAAYSVAIELTQLALARIDRACDVTDIVDNVSGAVAGAVLGAVLVLAARLIAARGLRRPGGGA